MDQELFRPHRTSFMNAKDRWQTWIDRVYRRNASRIGNGRLFMPRERCISEMHLSGNLVLFKNDGSVWDNGKNVGQVRDYILSKHQGIRAISA